MPAPAARGGATAAADRAGPGGAGARRELGKVIADFPPVVDGTPSGRAGPTYSPEAVEAMTAAVHAAGGRVAAHVTTDAVAHLVRAGVDSVEHGTALDESTLRLMAQAGTAWTPTLCA